MSFLFFSFLFDDSDRGQSKTFKALMEHARSSGSFRDVTATDDVLLTL